MTGPSQTTAVGTLPVPETEDGSAAAVLTRAVWVLWGLSLVALGAHLLYGPWRFGEFVVVDGLTVVLWPVVTFVSGLIHSYSRRYLAGDPQYAAFFRRIFGFTLAVMVLLAADAFALFAAAWLAMGLVMARLIGHHADWAQARASATLARRSFLASTGLLAIAFVTWWATTGVTTISGLTASGSSAPVLVAAGTVVLAAMVQSALVPFHTWLVSSMTAPTPASALMHAGFVNAGGILLVRVAPIITVDERVLVAIALVGASSALLGKFSKAVQPAVKAQLAASTVGQMGFMVMQIGLGFFAAAITHLVLHGFYKAYQFLSSGEQVTQASPTAADSGRDTGPMDMVVIGVTAMAAGGVFAVLTGKGLGVDDGLVLTGLVVLTVIQATREVAATSALPRMVRYGAVPVIALPAIALYAGIYRVIETLIAGLPAGSVSVAFSPVHGLLGAAFVIAYVTAETGILHRSKRCYVVLYNAAQPPASTVLTTREEYHEH